MTVIQQDCLEWMKEQSDASIDMVLTSPPYDNLRKYNGFDFDLPNMLPQIKRILKPGGVIIWNVADATIKGSETGTSMRQALAFIDAGFCLNDTMIYVKRNPMPTSKSSPRYHQAWEYIYCFSLGKPKTFNPIMRETKYTGQANMKYRGEEGNIEYTKTKRNTHTRINNVFQYTIGGGHTTQDKCAYGHPALMPEKLAEDQIISWSNAGDTVYDPFCGAGTTVKMAQLLNRVGIGTELNPDYVEIANKRIAALYEKTPKILKKT